MNGTVNDTRGSQHGKSSKEEIKRLNKQLIDSKDRYAKFHGDFLIGDPTKPKGFLANLRNSIDDFRRILTLRNAPEVGTVVGKLLAGQGIDIHAGAQLIGSMSNDSNRRAAFIESQVQAKYDKMLHPPLTYLGDAFQYRTADGKFNSALHPHLGQAGAPYAKTVPSKTHPLGALPDAGDIFDRLMARKKKRASKSGLSSMLIYHATIIIHDIFRTNDNDKNISDSSSYLDLSPLYGYTDKMQRSVRDNKYKLGLLKPDTFAEDRLLRQPPGVCIMLVMYNRYHNYAARQILRINENGKFSIPKTYDAPYLVATETYFSLEQIEDHSLGASWESYKIAWESHQKAWNEWDTFGQPTEDEARKLPAGATKDEMMKTIKSHNESAENYDKAGRRLQSHLAELAPGKQSLKAFEESYHTAWNKLDDDLFNTARLITCGMYVQVSVHDYLRALMGFHQYDTNFTLDPRIAMTEHKNVSRGLGNQVTVEFNLLYRFHCAISERDEEYTEAFLKEAAPLIKKDPKTWDPKKIPLQEWFTLMGEVAKIQPNPPKQPWQQTFGLQAKHFSRNRITGLFDDKQMMEHLLESMDDPISNFGPCNVPECMKNIELLGIAQARKWEIGTLNDFRDFFQLGRHGSFESITKNIDVQNALRDLYEHPDKVELYPGIFCESDKEMNVDPGPSDIDSALWSAIFSDAITLVRSDRFYTVDWNTNSLTSWGMKEVTPDNDILKSSVFHRLLQRAFPEWFPYDSIRFFHPFYTSEQNMKFAEEQGYTAEFRAEKIPAKPSQKSNDNPIKDYSAYAADMKPWKPVYLQEYGSIKALLSDDTDNFVHPARFELRNLPRKVADILAPGQTSSQDAPKVEGIEGDPVETIQYFTSLMRNIIAREVITMPPNDHGPVYQIDIVRDFAIPVTTCYVADFLGFGEKILKSADRPNAPYTEQEIYRHITNCQIFLSYNADETKLLKRRKAFRSSMAFLFELTKKANILEASRWPLTRWAKNTLGYVWPFGKRSSKNPMTALGLKVAEKVLEHERDAGRAAAILLLIALDSAYNSVLAFTSVLDFYITDLYKSVNEGGRGSGHSCTWLDLQRLAFSDDKDDINSLENKVLEAQNKSVELPIIRRAVERATIKGDGDKLIVVEKGQVVICDIYKAGQQSTGRTDAQNFSETDYLAYRSSFTQKFARYQPKHIAAMGLTSMIRTLAQMKNLRRGHNAQGLLKQLEIDESNEGYANFMAPGRMREIEAKAQEERERHTPGGRERASNVVTEGILKPSTNTYLTMEWDEIVPFPDTWKVRFDGFGESTYGGSSLPMLQQSVLPDDVPPFYQPQGASHYGGSFADTVCTAHPQKTPTAADKLETTTKGCGALGK